MKKVLVLHGVNLNMFGHRDPVHYGTITLAEISNYPPAKPGALRLLAPQRGLIAIGQNQNREPFVVDSVAKVLVVVIPAKAGIQFSLDSGSRFTCP